MSDLNDLLTPEQIKTLPAAARYALSDARVRDLVRAGTLTPAHLAVITTYRVSDALMDAGVRALMTEGRITSAQILTLSEQASYALMEAGVRELIGDGPNQIPMAQILALTAAASHALRDAGVRDLVIAGTLTPAHIAAITNWAASHALRDAGVRELIGKGPRRISIAQILALTYYPAQALMNAGVRALMTEGRITPAQILTLSEQASYALRDAGVREFIGDGPNQIPMAQILALNAAASTALRDAGVCDLVRAGTLTPAHIAAITTWAASRALRDADTQRRLRAGQITIEQIIGPIHPVGAGAGAGAGAGVGVAVNNAQSTHTASVHETASQSATELMELYGRKIQGSDLEKTIAAIKAYVTGLAEDVSKLSDDPKKSALENAAAKQAIVERNKAAKRCIPRITAVDFTFTDPASRISIKQLLALTWLCIHDESKRVGLLDDAKKQFVQGLYEIQRGYNLSEKSVDNGKADSPICTGGTFNGLIAALRGVHPNCKINFISKEVAALKLRIVAREEALQYLENLAKDANTPEKEDALKQLLAKLKEEKDVEAVWPEIESKVSDRMFEEFRSLYKNNKQSPGFTDFIGEGKCAQLDERFFKVLDAKLKTITSVEPGSASGDATRSDREGVTVVQFQEAYRTYQTGIGAPCSGRVGALLEDGVTFETILQEAKDGVPGVREVLAQLGIADYSVSPKTDVNGGGASASAAVRQDTEGLRKAIRDVVTTFEKSAKARTGRLFSVKTDPSGQAQLRALIALSENLTATPSEIRDSLKQIAAEARSASSLGRSQLADLIQSHVLNHTELFSVSSSLKKSG